MLAASGVMSVFDAFSGQHVNLHQTRSWLARFVVRSFKEPITSGVW